MAAKALISSRRDESSFDIFTVPPGCRVCVVVMRVDCSCSHRRSTSLMSTQSTGFRQLGPARFRSFHYSIAQGRIAARSLLTHTIDRADFQTDNTSGRCGLYDVVCDKSGEFKEHCAEMPTSKTRHLRAPARQR